MAEGKVYWVYMLASRSRVLYTGVTNDLGRRVAEHKLGNASAFTRKYQVNRLVYSEAFREVHSAIRREKAIKGWLRDKKIALIEEKNPAWADLAADWFIQAPQGLCWKAGPSLRSG
jgi:putative endonuclease